MNTETEKVFLRIVLGVAVIITIIFLAICISRKVKHDCFTDAYENYVNRVPAIFDALQPTEQEKVGSLYTPIICRPPERYGKKFTGRCRNELYPKNSSPYGKGEFVSPCNPEVLAKYYAQRPILSPDTYYDKLQELFNNSTDKLPPGLPINNFIYPIQFCNEDASSKCMKHIKLKLAKTKNELKSWKEYAKNDTWGGEQFAFWNEKIIAFSSHDMSRMNEQDVADLAKRNRIGGAKRYIVTFTLQNTLRSCSTDVIATLFEKENKMYLANIEFATLYKQGSAKQDGPTPYNIENAKTGTVNLNNSNLDPSSNMPSWIYKNTLENKIFNSHGFYDAVHPERNIVIPGGVPDEFGDILAKHNQGYLQPPYDMFSFKRIQGGPLKPTKYTTDTTSDVYPFLPDKPNVAWKVHV